MNNYKKIIFLALIFPIFSLLTKTCQGATGTTTIPITEDTYVATGIHMTNTSQERYLFAGYDEPGIRDKTRTFFKVDLSNFGIPIEDIYSANLKLYQYQYQGTNNYNLTLMSPKFQWEIDKITWLNQASAVTIAYFRDILPENGWKFFEITDHFKRWITNNIDKGLMLKMSPDEMPAVVFWSYDCIYALNLPTCENGEQPHIAVTHFVNTPPIVGNSVYPEDKSIVTEKNISLRLEGSTDPDEHKLSFSLELSKNTFKDILIKIGPQDEPLFSIQLDKPGRYLWRVKVTDERGDSTYSNIYSFIYTPKPQAKPKSNPKSQSNSNSTPPTTSQPSSNNNILGSSAISTSSESKEILTTDLCIIKYFTYNKKFELVSCKVSPPIIEKITAWKISSNSYSVVIEGQVNQKILLKILYYKCKDKTLFDPRTFFKCIDERFKEAKFLSNVKNYLIPDIDSSYEVTSSFIDKNGNFKLVLSLSDNPQGKQVKLSTRQTISDTVQSNRFVFTKQSDKSKPLNIPVISSQSKPLSYFFKKIIGVTQWYGKTAYQKLHTGIDFGATKENIYSPADGTVTFIGWDNYYGKCLSGGNMLKIKHKNNLHTAYFHLKSYSKNIKVGSNVKKGEYIGTTGNTGAFNCQPLAYHLHFETRKNSSYKSHTDPVPLVSANWSKIPTLGYKKYPGRLTGYNPHPGY